MKIVSITDEEILFDNGNTITFDHEQDCCEHNYADFEQLDDIARATDFDPNLEFVPQDDVGFLFGNTPGKMFFVPCFFSCSVSSALSRISIIPPLHQKINRQIQQRNFSYFSRIYALCQ